MNHEESLIQGQIVKELRHRGVLVMSFPNEFIKDARTMGTAITLGLLPGVSDLLVVLPGKLIFMEVKTATGVQSDKQKTFEKKVTELGYLYTVVRSLDEALKVVYS
jgi:predicted Holliday junction resolvase-like endonuclease